MRGIRITPLSPYGAKKLPFLGGVWGWVKGSGDKEKPGRELGILHIVLYFCLCPQPQFSSIICLGGSGLGHSALLIVRKIFRST